MTTNDPAAPWTVLRLLDWTREFFERANFECPRLEAEILLAHVLGCKRIELYTRFDYQPTPAELEAYRALVQRARKYEPVAYLIGSREFYSLKFIVTKDVLIPRAETELLVGEADSHLKSLHRPGLAWDACTGCGCVAIATAVQVKDATVLATDISESALVVASQNAQALNVADRVRVRVADKLTLPADCADMKDFDVITANPPYVGAKQHVSETVRHEPPVALYGGDDGLELIRPIVAEAPALLRTGGILAIEFGFGQADAVRDMMAATGQYHEPRILMDHQKIERSAVAKRK